ncbi:MAG: DUF1592 domain-containing protein [Limisphaerales bacterium]
MRTPRGAGRLGMAAVSLLILSGAAADPEAVFLKEIQPILADYCHACHGDEKQKGDLNLAGFPDLQTVLERRVVWTEVLGRVQADEMPPKGAKAMEYGRRQSLLTWLRSLPKNEPDCSQIATDRTQNFYRGHVMSRRLNRHEYDRTIRDLIGMDLQPGRLLPADGAGGEGFDTVGDTLFTSALAVEKYLDAADEVLNAVLPEDPDGLGPDAIEARRPILIANPGEQLAPGEAARRVVAEFARRAFRRPVTGEEVGRLLTMFERGWARGDGFDASVRLALKAVLVSPHFLFLVEPEPEASGTQPLGAFPLASRLSYFLWSSMPDEELWVAAETGDLLRPEGYQAQIRRMLKDPRASALGERFALQWLELERLGGEVRPDAGRFPEFDAELAESMRAEVVAFFNDLIREDRSLIELIDSRHAFVNERLAGLYGLESVRGDELRRVAVTDPARGGVLGMPAIHAVTSFPLRTSPVLRGKWILEVLLGERVPPPPPDVPPLKVSEEGVTAASLREQLQIHRQDPNCAACHDRMDPLGFGMETFDVLGRWRGREDGHEVDASGVLPSGERFSGPAELKGILLRRQDQVMRHFVRKLTGYAFGRELNAFDDCVARDAMKALETTGHRPSALIETIATSFPFRHRFHAQTESNPEGS